VATPLEVVEFRVEDPVVVVEHMDRLGRSHSGWVNMRPAIPADEEPPSPSPLAAIFSTSVHEVPVCTWVAGPARRHGTDPDSLGVQHAAGTRTAAKLRALGVGIPAGWRVVQDHPRRGLVLLAPDGTSHSEEVAWLLEAGTALSRIRLNGAWRAEVHSRR
jgi:hypothetical protein